MQRIASQIGCLLGFACAAIVGRPAAALVVMDVSSANASAPSDDPGWANVGDNGIYIGNRWVLTAYHAGVNPVSFAGVGTFDPRPGTEFRLKNPTGLGLSEYTDLLMFQLTTDPGLPGLSIGSATPAVGANVVLISDGNAVTPGTPETSWTGTTVESDPDWTVGGSDFFGYVSNTRVKLWGTNLVEDDGQADADHNLVFDIGFGDVITFATEFDKPGETDGAATDDEAQALAFDSGGAVFHKPGDGWKLAGVTDAIGTFTNQPGALQSAIGQTAVFGNATFYVDLSFYSDQILAVPEAGAGLLTGSIAAGAGLWRGVARASRRLARRRA